MKALIIGLALVGIGFASPLGIAAEVFAPGDMDCDRQVESGDALLVLRTVAELPIPEFPCAPDGDFDGDGDVDSVDALRILRIHLGDHSSET